MRSQLLATSLLTGLLALSLAVPAGAVRVTLLHNNDGESKLRVPTTGAQAHYGGIAHFVTLARQLRTSAELAGDAVVMVSSGDNFLAGPEWDASLTHGVPYYDGLALDAVAYDALAIGNHEFDFGPDVLAGFVQSFPTSQPPFLSANLGFAAEPGLLALQGAGRIRKSVVVTRAGVAIGIVGATTPRLRSISSPRNTTIDANLTAAIQSEVDALTLAGVRIIILISHLQSITEDLALLPTLRGIDLAVAGGGSEVLANPGQLLVPGHVAVAPYPRNAVDADGRTVPVVTTEGDYFYVGRLVADFDAAGNLLSVDPVSGPVRVATPSSGQADAVTADAGVEVAVVQPVAAHVTALAAQIIGSTEVALDGRRTEVRSRETNQGNLIADALLWKARQLAAEFGAPLPQIALQNGGGIRNNSILPAGNLSELSTFSMLPFSNFVSIVPGVSPAQLKQILENAVSRVSAGDGRFAQVAGMRFGWYPGGTAQVISASGDITTPGTRVDYCILDDGTRLIEFGAPVPGAPAVSIATIDFLANGGDQYPFAGLPLTSLGVSYQQALSDYIQIALSGQVRASQYPSGGSGRIRTFDAVSTLASLIGARGADGVVEVEWSVSVAGEVTVERSTAGGAWERIARLVPDGDGRVRFHDSALEPGRRYGYRLAIPQSGSLVTAGETWVELPAANSLALSRLSPNPAVGRTTVSFTLAENAPAALEIVDLSGRRVLARDLSALGRGSHVMELEFGGRLPAGLYWARLVQKSQVRTAMLTVMP